MKGCKFDIKKKTIEGLIGAGSFGCQERTEVERRAEGVEIISTSPQFFFFFESKFIVHRGRASRRTLHLTMLPSGSQCQFRPCLPGRTSQRYVDRNGLNV